MTLRLLPMLLAGLIAGQFSQTRAQDAAADVQTCAVNIKPRTQEYPWMTIERRKRMHQEQLARADEGNVDLMFLGDSITDIGVESWP